MSFDVATALESAAPTLATMLGGPLAGTAVGAIESAFGLSPKSDTGVADRLKQIGDAIQAGKMTPDVLLKLKQVDQQNAQVIGQQKIDLAKINADSEAAMAQTREQDRDSARKRQIALKDRTPAHLAYIIIFGFFLVCGALLWTIVTESRQVQGIGGQGWLLIGTITGYLANEAKAAAAYFFGNTASTDSMFKKQTETSSQTAKSVS